ncbi:MAG: M48 family metallopeptidase [Bdellovibrionales bacterium]|nr:M48 family metallopeptidase [Bdellovibrionales bacterium]MBT3525958.1 M48 family metallopeptidase [Bdellovibrionales bacterium]MBT7669617.1 M48 family metallopeptidase [Bdellovibrionales bacterium]
MPKEEKEIDLMLEQSVEFGKSKINYRLSRSDRKTLGITVEPSGEVSVNAPLAASLYKIEEVIKKRASWILRQKQEIASYPPTIPSRKYITGEAFRHLGKQYRLKVVGSDSDKVLLRKNIIEVHSCKGDTPDIIESLLKEWLKLEAESIFSNRLIYCMQFVEKIGVNSAPYIKLRKMRKRWGSCTQDGLIFLNPELITAPLDCIDYVIIHELCHLKEHSHSKRFFQLLDIALPSWAERKRKLDYIEIYEL